MNDFKEYDLAVQELDEITIEGFFGNIPKQLVLKRDSMDNNDFLYESIHSIFSNDQYGKENIIEVVNLLLHMFAESFKIGGQEVVDIMTSFYKGTKDNPELESMSSYVEYARNHMEFKNLNDQLMNKETITIADKKNLAGKILSVYSKGVEMVGKSFTQLLSIQQIINGQKYSILDNSFLSIYRKTEEFLKLSNGKYDKLATMIDRRVRNADSHLNAYYSIREQKYILKTTGGKGKNKKIQTFKISIEKMLLDIYPQIGWFIQGLISTEALFVLAFEDNAKFQSAYKYILSFKET